VDAGLQSDVGDGRLPIAPFDDQLMRGIEDALPASVEVSAMSNLAAVLELMENARMHVAGDCELGADRARRQRQLAGLDFLAAPFDG